MKYLSLIVIVLAIVTCDDPAKTDDDLDINMDDENWITIGAGRYTRGETNQIDSITYGYQIMKFEVTNEEYVNFLNEARAVALVGPASGGIVSGIYDGDSLYNAGEYLYTYTSEFFSGISYFISFNDGIYTADSNYANHPIDHLSWFGAHAYAKHYGYELPSTAEWEKAARGETGWKYPWGNTKYYNVNRIANLIESGDPYDNGTTPVGYYDGTTKDNYTTLDGSSPYGLYDLGGNVGEWTRSIASETGFRISKGTGWLSNYIPENWFEFGMQPPRRTINGLRCVKYE